MFQSTHPHGVRPCLRLCLMLLRAFQSTHPHGVRQSIMIFTASVIGFQSTHPHGVRRLRTQFSDFALPVSIHAPTRGATNSRLYTIYKCIRFNPRTHTGCDARMRERFRRKYGFNPRTHTGCDCTRYQRPKRPRVSIHAPTRGATQTYKLAPLSSDVSIHAPTRGATTSKSMPLPNLQFQSTHPHGVRLRKNG